MIHLLLAAVVASSAPMAASGEYGQLKLAFSSGRVSGEFNEVRMGNGTDQAPQFSCIFALTGAWKPGVTQAPVLTWWPGDDPPDERIRGRLTVRDGTATLSLDENPGGCEMTGEDFKATPFSEDLRTKRPWLELREVRSLRAHFSDTAGGAPTRGYVTRGDVVGITSRIGGFVHVDYVDGRQPVQGWLQETDLEPAAPHPR